MESWITLEVIDWEVGIRLAGNNLALAQDMLGLLVKNLNKDITTIQHYLDLKNYTKMQYHVHRLHGALAYCGAVRLKEMIAYADNKLKQQKYDSLPELMQQLTTEAALLISTYDREIQHANKT